MLSNYSYEDHKDSPEKLAERIIDQLEVEGNLMFPIDPFYLLSRFDVSYKLMNFEELEGIYIVSDSNGPSVVGINRNRPISRQRFTAAHELCHHIKDRNLELITCPIGEIKDPIEIFANQFAAELLMPTKYLIAKVNEFSIDGKVSFESALKISMYFGVSFQTCVYSLAYRLQCIEGNIESSVLKDRIRDFKPNSKKLELNSGLDLHLHRQLINNYTFINPLKEGIIWYRFKNNYIANEEKLEGNKLNLYEL